MLKSGVGRPPLGRLAWAFHHLVTDFLWTAWIRSWRSVEKDWVQNTWLIGRTAWVWLISALHFTDASINGSTFLLRSVWVLKLSLDTECGPNLPLLKPFDLCLWTLDGTKLDWLGFVLRITLAKFRDEIPQVICRPAWPKPSGLGFFPFWLNFLSRVPATTTHSKLFALVRNKQNMYGTWCKDQFIFEKLTVEIWNNGRQQLALPFLALFYSEHFEKWNTCTYWYF